MSEYGVWARRSVKHTSPETYGTRCDRCPKLVCTEVERSRLHPWKYYCEARSKNMELRELYAVSQDECPLHRELKRRTR